MTGVFVVGDSVPPGSVAPGSVPSGSVAPGSVPSGSAPSGFMPPKQKIKDTYLPYTLLGVALIGVVVEAVLIYVLYQRTSQTQVSPDTRTSPTMERLKGDHPDSNEIPPLPKMPDKPAAYLHGKSPQVDAHGVMQWQSSGQFAFAHGVTYRDGGLELHTEGFYYIFSKVYFSDKCSIFSHKVFWVSKRYNLQPHELMQSISLSCPQQTRGRDGGQRRQTNQSEPEEQENLGNSFLGGVFRLYRGDRVFVNVSDSSLVRQGVQDNFFGVFMI
ncbi:tumor necrosis factor ligand superfamily member 6 [Trichomycterus rosablanca]|uniref:tumor necrosis factor ligand superfamily member 6 n=1 Tax=Trichomycterus rosablanca TaxID=2290929 RepID=UPI002F3510BD